MNNKFFKVWSFALSGILFLAWCWVIPISLPLEGFFWTVEQDYPEHPMIRHVSLIQKSEFLQANSEYHLEASFDPRLFSETNWFFWSGSIVTLKLDAFETNEITTANNQIHKLDVKGNIDLKWNTSDSNYEFDGKIYLFSDTKNREHYLFIDELTTKKSWKSLGELDLRLALMNTQIKRRIKIENSKFLDFLQVGHLHKVISNESISNRRMEDPEGVIYTSWNDLMDIRMQTDWITNIAAVNFIQQNIWIQASSWDSKNYLIEWDRWKEKYGGEISWTMTHEIERNWSIHAWNWIVSFPKWLNASFSYREKLSKLSNKTNDYQFPNQYVSFDSLINEKE